jgi:hypothetical protein
LVKNLPVTGMFFASSGIVHPNYTEILLPDMQDEVMSNMTRFESPLLNFKNPYSTLHTARTTEKETMPIV